MPSIIFRGKIIDGKINLERDQEFAAHVARLNGKPIELILRPEKAQRSRNQNSYYHGVVVKLLAEFCGYDSVEMHEALKMRFLLKQDGPLPTVRSTTDLDTAEFTEYVESCRRLAAEMGVAIPSPGEVDLSAYA